MKISTKLCEQLLPFFVVEAVTQQGASLSNMTFKMADKGWAWLVSGRKLITWRFRDNNAPGPTTRRRHVLSLNFVLQLPQSDLINKADLINVFFMPTSMNVSTRAVTVPAAVAVSPEGTIRFWPNVSDDKFVESNAVDLQGQEFCQLIPISPIEYLMSTTTGSILKLTIDINAHQHKGVLLCSPLTQSGGLLSDFSRRMSSLIFGPTPSVDNVEPRRPLILVPKLTTRTDTEMTDVIFFVMNSSFKLREWSQTDEDLHNATQLIRDWDLQKSITTLIDEELNITGSNLLRIIPIDIAMTAAKELLLLIAVINTSRDNRVNYVTCTFNPYQAGDAITNLTVLRAHSWHYADGLEDKLYTLKFLDRHLTTNITFMADRKLLFLVKTDQDIIDAIDYGNQSDEILGSGSVCNQPILFTQREGLVYISIDESQPATIQHRADDLVESVEPIEPSSSHASQESKQQQQQQPPVATSTPQRSKSKSKQRHEPMLIEIDEDEETENQPRPSKPVKVDKPYQEFNSIMNESLRSHASVADATTAKLDDEVERIIKTEKEFEWLEQIACRQYSKASETLARLSESNLENSYLKDRQETLLALSKLAKLAE